PRLSDIEKSARIATITPPRPTHARLLFFAGRTNGPATMIARPAIDRMTAGRIAAKLIAGRFTLWPQSVLHALLRSLPEQPGDGCIHRTEEMRRVDAHPENQDQDRNEHRLLAAKQIGQILILFIRDLTPDDP